MGADDNIVAMRRYFGGIEGGGSRSRMVLVDEEGTLVAESEGLDTNHFCIGYDECGRRLHDMVKGAKQKAGLQDDEAITSLGMSLCGMDYPEIADKIVESLELCGDTTAEHFYVCNDTMCPIFTSSNSGGMVLIAGTGSNCNVTNNNGNSYYCGGYDRALGSEGSAAWISLKGVKTVLDAEDNLVVCPHDVSFVKQTIFDHFAVSSKQELFDKMYSVSDRVFAKMCIALSRGAMERKDPLCIQLFKEAGFLLARHVLALAPQADEDLVAGPGGLHVVCVGSVWESWDVLREGFVEGLTSRPDVTLPEVSLVRLKVPAAIGAAYLGAKHAGYSIEMDYENNTEVFFHYLA